MQSDQKITTIKQIKFVGKWAEIWSEESPNGDGRWDESCKGYMLWGLAEKAGLVDRIHNYGFVGLQIIWGKKPEWTNVEPIILREKPIPKSKMKFQIKYHIESQVDRIIQNIEARNLRAAKRYIKKNIKNIEGSISIWCYEKGKAFYYWPVSK